MEKDLTIILKAFEAFNASLKNNITDSAEFKRHVLLVEASLDLLRNELNTNVRFTSAMMFKENFEYEDIKAFETIIKSVDFKDTTDAENFNTVKDIAIYAIYTLINLAAKKGKKEKNNE